MAIRVAGHHGADADIFRRFRQSVQRAPSVETSPVKIGDAKMVKRKERGLCERVQ
jgi:hypothetical protein